MEEMKEARCVARTWDELFEQCVREAEDSPGPRGPCRDALPLLAARIALQRLVELPATERCKGLDELEELIPAERDKIMRHWTNDPPNSMVDPIIEASSSFDRAAGRYSQVPPESMREVYGLGW